MHLFYDVHYMLNKLFISFFVFFTLFYNVSLAWSETITIVADSWCPYNCEPTAEKKGYMIEIAQEAFKKHGITIDYKTMPWTRAVEETRMGKYTAIVGSAYTDAPNFIFPTVKQGISREGFFVKKGNNWQFKDIKSLESISIGVISGYTHGDQIDTYIEANKNNFKRVQSAFGDKALDMNLKKLNAGRVGALLENIDVMTHHIKEHHKEGEIKLAGLIQDDKTGLYIAFSPSNPNSQKYADILSKETKIMRETGKIKEIMSHYGLEEFSEN